MEDNNSGNMGERGEDKAVRKARQTKSSRFNVRNVENEMTSTMQKIENGHKTDDQEGGLKELRYHINTVWQV